MNYETLLATRRAETEAARVTYEQARSARQRLSAHTAYERATVNLNLVLARVGLPLVPPVPAVDYDELLAFDVAVAGRRVMGEVYRIAA